MPNITPPQKQPLLVSGINKKNAEIAKQLAEIAKQLTAIAKQLAKESQQPVVRSKPRTPPPPI